MSDTPTYYELKSVEKDGNPKVNIDDSSFYSCSEPLHLFVDNTEKEFGRFFIPRDGRKLPYWEDIYGERINKVTHYLLPISLPEKRMSVGEAFENYKSKDIARRIDAGLVPVEYDYQDFESGFNSASQFPPSSTQEGMKEEAVGFANYLNLLTYRSGKWYDPGTRESKTTEQLYDLYQSQKQKA